MSYHRTLALRTKSPSVVDSGGDALMAAMSVPVSQECPGGNLADMVSSLQQQVLALQSDRGKAGDIDALGKGGGKGTKGRRKRGGVASLAIAEVNGCLEWSARCRQGR